MTAMHRRSTFHPIPCDLKRLPIGALEVFVLSCVGEGSTAEQVAESAGLELEELLKVARRLVELGALSVDGDKGKTRRPAPLRRTEEPPPPSRRTGVTSLVPPAVAPLARPCPDVRSLGIGPREGFILSQIDGATSMADLVEITHLTAREVSDALHVLEAAGAIELPHRKHRAHAPHSNRATKAPPASTKAPHARATKAPPSRATKAPPSRATKAPPSRATKAPPSRATKAPPSRATNAPPAQAPRAPEKRLSELPEADRTRIATDAARFEGLDHYGALGVERDSDAKTIRRAYHALAAQFHPDRFFSKNLGASRQPLERIFARLTRAYEALSKKGTRDEYDATLPPRPSAPTPSPPSPIPVPPVPPAAPVPASVVRVAPPAAPVSVPAVRASAPAAPVSVPAVRVSAPAVPPPSPAALPPGAHPLGRIVPEKKRSPLQERLDVFVRAAQEALARDDLVAAANNYRLAAQVSPEPAIRAALEATDAKARARVREVSLAAAQAAEKDGRWSEAAAKYVKAHGAQGEAWIAERAAHALRREGADLRRAAQLAEQAVQAEPNDVGFRVTLGEIYLDAGHLARASAESARALALAPANARATALARLVAKSKRA